MKILYLLIGLVIGFGLTFIQRSGAEQKPIIQTVTETKYETITEEVPVNQTEPMEAIITAYSNGPESTGKHPGDKWYGITATGVKTHPGTCAVDPKLIKLGSSLYIEGIGYCHAEDLGGKIRGAHVDVWMSNEQDALQFGKQTRKVWVLKDY